MYDLANFFLVLIWHWWWYNYIYRCFFSEDNYLVPKKCATLYNVRNHVYSVWQSIDLYVLYLRMCKFLKKIILQKWKVKYLLHSILAGRVTIYTTFFFKHENSKFCMHDPFIWKPTPYKVYMHIYIFIIIQ